MYTKNDAFNQITYKESATIRIWIDSRNGLVKA